LGRSLQKERETSKPLCFDKACSHSTHCRPKKCIGFAQCLRLSPPSLPLSLVVGKASIQLCSHCMVLEDVCTISLALSWRDVGRLQGTEGGHRLTPGLQHVTATVLPSRPGPGLVREGLRGIPAALPAPSTAAGGRWGICKGSSAWGPGAPTSAAVPVPGPGTAVVRADPQPRAQL